MQLPETFCTTCVPDVARPAAACVRAVNAVTMAIGLDMPPRLHTIVCRHNSVWITDSSHDEELASEVLRGRSPTRSQRPRALAGGACRPGKPAPQLRRNDRTAGAHPDPIGDGRH